MTIDKFKIDGNYITVDYHGLSESFRIATCDEAKPSLYKATANVAIGARVLLGLGDLEGAGFFAIAFSHGDNPGTRIVLTMATAKADPAKIACPKLGRGEYRDPDSFQIIEDHPGTWYERAVAVLENEIEKFVLGKRAQMSLPFDQSPEERKLTADVSALVGEEEASENSDLPAAAGDGGRLLRFDSAASVAP